MENLVNGVDYSKIGPDDVRVGKGGNSPLKRMLDHPDHGQSIIAEVIRRERPNTMIETGVESGYSSEHYLTAMDANGMGHLFSCDPTPSGFYNANPIVHPRFALIRKTSNDCLDEIYAKTGPLDFFLHDSNHNWETQMFEYFWAWKHVRHGGIIASDDVGWGINIPGEAAFAHGAWELFTRYYHVTNLRQKANNFEYFKKP